MGPGDYFLDIGEGVTRVADLPNPIVEQRTRSYRRRACPQCGRGSCRHSIGHRVLHEVGDIRLDRPRDLVVIYSKHYCAACDIHFNVDTSDLAPPGSHYTTLVISIAVRLVVEDGLPYRISSWHMWRDHRVFIPFATIQDWVENAGKKPVRESKVTTSTG